ncbi:MAG: B12-binding domain-containing radical SAM protein [Elusimicrobia bacterium RIFOXYB2_FULL_62_6]|nr:MAG: B12-binding domain-containing radical SAM protein [Elusimicrobia bacterium RIFOXYB2_FULL_62_6]
MADKYSLDPGLYQQAVSPADARYMEQLAGQAKTPCATDKSKPRIALVVGPTPFAMMRGWEFFITSPYEGISCIATVLHNAGYPVRIIDVRYALDPLREAFKQVMEGTDVVGITTGEDGYPFVEELIALLKEKDPKLPVILGGSLVTSAPRVFMENTRADVAVISEGEITILELMDSFTAGSWQEKRLSEINGIWYRSAAGEILHTPPRGQMQNLDCVPPMNLSLWPQAKGPLGLQPQVIASHSRGCKMDCSFCYRTTPQLREKSPARLRAELKVLTEVYKTSFIMFSDLTFTSNKKRALEICEVIKEFRIHWACMTRCTDVDPEMLAAMRAAGCDIILFGVESLSPDVQKAARKGYTENLVLRTFRDTQEAGIVFGGLTIVGLPRETEESLEHLCQWAEETQSICRVKYLAALPGTNVYTDSLQKGIIRGELEHLRWLSTEQGLVHDEFLNYNGLPEKVMRRAYERIVASYCKGPVMDFKHWPENFAYFYPDSKKEWRSKYTYAGAPLAPGAERFLLPHLTGQSALNAAQRRPAPRPAP